MRGKSAALLLAMLSLAALPGQAQEFDGTWRGDFDGLSMVIDGHDLELYQTSSHHRSFVQSARIAPDATLLGSDGRILRLRREGGRLLIHDERGELFLALTKVAQLPPETPATDDPGTVFDVLWESFAENYALFELTGIDWLAARETWRPQALASADDGDLFDLFTTMLAPLNDRHTTLVRTDPGAVYKPGPPLDPFWDGQENRFLNLVAEHYLGAPLRSRYTDPRLRFGVLPGNVGYLAASSFLDSALTPDYARTLDAVLGELDGVDALIIDLRFNLGGTDRNTRAVMERLLAPGTSAVYRRRVRLSRPLPQAYTEEETLRVEPLDHDRWQRPLALLTSANTASAAEGLLLALLYAPRAVQVGETTRGVFSRLLFRDLPNGWWLTLSNQRYTSLGGISYEQAGIPPQITVAQADYDVDGGVDAALDAALAALAGQPARVPDPFAIGTAVSGLWFDPAREGEGWHIQRVSGEAVFVTFYTFDPERPGRQIWVVGLGQVEDQAILVERLFITEGGVFGSGPGDPTGIVEVDWGRAEIRFSDCNTAVAEVSGPDRFRGFVFRLQRLSAIPGLGCAPPGAALRSPALAGAWYVAARPGEGWLLSHSAPGKVVVSWYTFDALGEPYWLIGVGEADVAGRLLVTDLFSASGTRYGHGFDASTVQLRRAGALEFSLAGCNAGTVVFTPDEPDAEPLSFPVDRVLFVEGLGYPDGCGAAENQPPGEEGE